MKVLIAVATYNEVKNIPTLVERLNQIVPDADILIVDDDSPDGTGQWCKEASLVNDHLDVIIRKDERGLGSATIRGMQEAIDRGYDVWLGMDADFSHPPEKVPALISRLADSGEREVDVVVGSRYTKGGGVDGWPVRRRLMSRGVNLYARTLMGLPVKDCSGAFRCCRTTILERIDLGSFRSTGYSFFEEFLWHAKRAGARFAEVPFTFTDRRFGASKLNGSEAAKSLAVMARLGVKNWLKF